MSGLSGMLPAGMAVMGLLAGVACQAVRHPPAMATRVESTTGRLVALHTTPARHAVVAEARRLATVAEAAARSLPREYRVGGPAWMHNCMVNTGLRTRGLCWHYMEDLFARLAALHPVYFDLHCGVRDDENLFLEHNCVVVTAAGGDFAGGLVLDPWRKPGRLLVIRANGEGKPWHEQTGYTQTLRARAARGR